MKNINVTQSSMPDFEEYLNEIKDIWESHWLTNMGPKHNELAKGLEKYLGIKNVVLYTNGHLALEGIWESLNFPEGSEVITTPFTFVSTTHAIVRNGLVPIFCDINPRDYTIDVDKIEELITDKTVAICPVHVYGNVCDVIKISEIAKKHNLVVVYDAAHAFGVKYKGLPVANYGDLVMFSFHATKVFNTIEGGCICFNNDSFIEKLNDLKNFGIHGPESVPYVGGNAKMNEFQAAMGLCNLRHVDNEILKRKSVYEHYLSRLDGVDGVILNKVQDDTVSNYSYFPVVFKGYRKSRNAVFDELKQHGITARKYFYPAINELECFKDADFIKRTKTPIAKFISDNILALPMYANLSKEEIDNICDIILG